MFTVLPQQPIYWSLPAHESDLAMTKLPSSAKKSGKGPMPPIPLKWIFAILGLLLLLIYQIRQEEALPPTEEELNRRAILRYVAAYKNMAVNEMHRTGIPASITLAQGILESRYGTSELATKANNHFGVKADQTWLGARYCVYSDEWVSARKRMEPQLSCFRYYDSPAESFRNHSDFLKERPRYAKLFRYSATQYEAWARGLSECGYATDPEYAQKLIGLIERFALYQADVASTTVKF